MSMVDKIKARLVEDAADWHRWWSMRWIILASAMEAFRQGWAQLPADWSAALPHWVPSLLGTTSLFATVMAAASRVVKQTPKP
jgi:hypothetical protein